MARLLSALRQIRHDETPTFVRVRDGQSAGARHPDASVEYSARILSVKSLDDHFIAQWRALATRALEPNVYLSPHFVLPALQHLGSADQTRIIAISRQSGENSLLVGLGVFQFTPPSRHFPFTCLTAFQSVHSYLSGLLADRNHAEPAVEKFFEFVTRPSAPWHGVKFRDCETAGPVFALMQTAARKCRATWHPTGEFQRAVLRPRDCGTPAYAVALERCPGKDWRRKVNRMIESGEATWRFLAGNECDDAAVLRFLALEDRDWAREEGTSLRAAGHEAFFRDMCDGMAGDGQLFITELIINDQVVASACNFRVGTSGFAFKIGWDQSFAKLKPGIVNELMLIREAPTVCPEITSIDSGSTAGSFIEGMWPERVTIGSGMFATSQRGRVAADVWDFLRDQKVLARQLVSSMRHMLADV
jgi:CelD/BcsL family acetyltransferase involved in cellulose biosynthesis